MNKNKIKQVLIITGLTIIVFDVGRIYERDTILRKVVEKFGSPK